MAKEKKRDISAELGAAIAAARRRAVLSQVGRCQATSQGSVMGRAHRKGRAQVNVIGLIALADVIGFDAAAMVRRFRHSRRVGVGIERCALYATDNQESEPRGIKKSPFSLCDCLCSGILPLERADSARTKLWCKLSGGLHHAEDCNCTGCILGDAERRRRCRPASQGAAASGASSGWQVAGRQGSDRQISTSSARRDQGLTVLDARKIERSGCAFHYHAYAPLRRGISFD